jgi:DNA-directed RNA polymerase subunit RPC12/RpoP
MNTFAKLSQEFGHYLVYLTSELFFYSEQPHSLSEMERKMRAMLLRVGQFLLGSWLAVQETSHLDETAACPYCGGQAIFKFKQDDILLTTLGQVGYSRSYFVCPDCQQGHYPLDQKLGLRPGRMSAELESLAGMTGAQPPLEQGSKLFEALILISMSDRCLAEASRAPDQLKNR